MYKPLQIAIWLRPVIVSCVLVSGCNIINANSPKLAAAQHAPGTTRTVTVSLLASTGSGFEPAYQDRIITAEPVTTATVTRAQAQTIVQGITTIVIGESCEVLNRNYPAIQECKELDSTERHYGEIESTVTTDSKGAAVLVLGAGEYRISMQAWQTAEDNKCSWSGSEILPESSSVLELPVLVFCE